jgi:membrane-associated phospholipid phosphatase
LPSLPFIGNDGSAMRSLSSTDISPLARYSAWSLLILLGHMCLNHLDDTVHNLMRGAGPSVFVFFRAVTEVGDSKWTLIPTGALGLVSLVAGRYLISGHHLAAMARWLSAALFFIFTSVAFSGIAANIIKVIVGRGRPKLLDQSNFIGFDPFTLNANFHSFPSGHTNTAIALALGISLLIPRWRAGLLTVAGIVGFSRVVVNAHFVTDVIGGAALAVLMTLWVRQGFAALGLVFIKNARGEYRLGWPGRLIPVATRYYIRRLPLIGPAAPGKVGSARRT